MSEHPEPSALGSIRELYIALYNIDHSTEEFAAEFFYMVGELLNGKRLDELKPSGVAAAALNELLAGKERGDKE